MTTVITRYFESAAKAKAVRRELVQRQRFSSRIVHLFDEAEGLTDKLTAMHVLPETAKAYEAHMPQGGAVLLVQAGYKPLAVAKTTREITAEMGAADMKNLVEEVVLKDPPKSQSILQDHPLILSRPRDPDSTTFHMADWPIPLISRREPFSDAVFPPHSHMANWPIGLISKRKPYTGSIFRRHARMANFPIPLISKRKPSDKFAFPRHARMANFPIPLISKRKPFTGSLFPRHQRMATVPFPLLINGKTGQNALMPGHPRMANFPIGLISKRTPSDNFAFPRHARMANFPIPLISKRKPSDKMAIPRHGRMADMILPLTIRNGEAAGREKKEGFSFSKMLGLPTIVRR